MVTIKRVWKNGIITSQKYDIKCLKNNKKYCEFLLNKMLLGDIFLHSTQISQEIAIIPNKLYFNISKYKYSDIGGLTKGLSIELPFYFWTTLFFNFNFYQQIKMKFLTFIFSKYKYSDVREVLLRACPLNYHTV